MRKYLILISIFSFFYLSFTFSQQQNTSSAEIKTSAVCEMCKERIENKLNKLNGIVEANLDLDKKILFVRYDTTKVELKAIKKKITELGYDADEMKRDPKAYKKLPKCCKIDG